MVRPRTSAALNKRIDDEVVIEEASRHLRRLFFDTISWNEGGADTSSPKKRFGAAIGLVGCVFEEAECALNEAGKCRLNKRARGAIDDAIQFIKFARKAAIPVLRQARPPKGRHGKHGDLNASRDQTIAETVASIRKQFGLSQEQASWVVSQALARLAAEHEQAFRRLIGADRPRLDECLLLVNGLRLSEDRIEDIAKKYRAFRE
jgi:hypothetical protein